MSTVTKKPQDRKPKKDAVREVTLHGVTFEIDPEILDDLDVLDALDQIQEGNGLRVAGLLRKLTGEKFNEMRDALRDPDSGRIPVAVASDFMGELFEAIAPN